MSKDATTGGLFRFGQPIREADKVTKNLSEALYALNRARADTVVTDAEQDLDETIVSLRDQVYVLIEQVRAAT